MRAAGYRTNTGWNSNLILIKFEIQPYSWDYQGLLAHVSQVQERLTKSRDLQGLSKVWFDIRHITQSVEWARQIPRSGRCHFWPRSSQLGFQKGLPWGKSFWKNKFHGSAGVHLLLSWFDSSWMVPSSVVFENCCDVGIHALYRSRV